jgi:two-component system response regulator NreC
MDKCRVLMVDDRARAREALLAAVPPVQAVGEAVDGQEAMHLVKEQRPGVVLADARMPGMDGLEATRRIKDLRPEVRVGVLAIHLALRAEALTAGADAFLVKGCSAELLLAAILDRQEQDEK